MQIWSWFDQAIPTNSYGLKFYSDWKIRLFQFLAEISDCGRDFKFGWEFQTIKHHQKYGSGEIFCPGREFPIRSIFKTEIIRTKIVDWGFSRYISPKGSSVSNILLPRSQQFFARQSPVGLLDMFDLISARLAKGAEVAGHPCIVACGGPCIQQTIYSRYHSFAPAWIVCATLRVSLAGRLHESSDCLYPEVLRNVDSTAWWKHIDLHERL